MQPSWIHWPNVARYFGILRGVIESFATLVCLRCAE